MKINEIEAGQKVPFRQDTSSGYNAPPELPEVEQILSVVKQNCSESIAAMMQAKKFLYRGVHSRGDSATPIAFHGRSRNDRNPMSTGSTIDAIVNKGLVNSGFKALRNNSIFCTSNKQTASFYGDHVYFIFPKDGFNYGWNTKYMDYYTDFVDNLQAMRVGPDAKKHQQRVIAKMEADSDHSDFAQKYDFLNTEFTLALESGHEIFISGEYYALYHADFNQYISKLFQ